MARVWNKRKQANYLFGLVSCGACQAAIASKLAPTLDFRRSHYLGLAQIKCGSELARDGPEITEDPDPKTQKPRHKDTMPLS
jgi:hypothetical protein